MCHVSGVTLQVSGVTIYMFFIIFFCQSSLASWWRVCYQQGLPRLVLIVDVMKMSECIIFKKLIVRIPNLFTRV